MRKSKRMDDIFLSRLLKDATVERYNKEYRQEHGTDPQMMDPEMYERFKEYVNTRREEAKKKGGKN